MGNRVSTNTAIEETTKQLKEEVEIGEDPPGVHPAVLLSVCYWEDPKPITKGPTADESLEEEPQPISVNYDEIIKAVQKVTMAGYMCTLYIIEYSMLLISCT